MCPGLSLRPVAENGAAVAVLPFCSFSSGFTLPVRSDGRRGRLCSLTFRREMCGGALSLISRSVVGIVSRSAGRPWRSVRQLASSTGARLLGSAFSAPPASNGGEAVAGIPWSGTAQKGRRMAQGRRRGPVVSPDMLAAAQRAAGRRLARPRVFTYPGQQQTVVTTAGADRA